jgi:hypothetical protein
MTPKQISERLSTLEAIAYSAQFSDKPDEMLGHVAFGIEDLLDQMRDLLAAHKRRLRDGQS